MIHPPNFYQPSQIYVTKKSYDDAEYHKLDELHNHVNMFLDNLRRCDACKAYLRCVLIMSPNRRLPAHPNKQLTHRRKWKQKGKVAHLISGIDKTSYLQLVARIMNATFGSRTIYGAVRMEERRSPSAAPSSIFALRTPPADR